MKQVKEFGAAHILSSDFKTQTRRALFFHSESDSYYELINDPVRIQEAREHMELAEVTNISWHEKAFLEDLW